MEVSEKISNRLSVIIIVLGMILNLTEGLGRYVIEQKHKHNNNSQPMEHRNHSRWIKGDTPLRIKSSSTEPDNDSSSVSGHRVPVTGPRQLQKQQFDSTNVRTETVLVMSVLGGALVCLILLQVWRQIRAFRKRRLRHSNNNQIVESLKQQTGAPWNREQIQIVSAELVSNGDAYDDIQDCDCEIKTGVHHQRGYEKVACLTTSITDESPTDDNFLDSLMMQQTFSHHRPEVVHVNMNIVQVVHHCGEPDASKCRQDGCAKTHNKKNVSSSDQIKKKMPSTKNVISSLIPAKNKEGYQNTVLDLDESKNTTEIWDNNSTPNTFDQTRLSPANVSRKSCSGQSFISNGESSDSDRYDTVVNLQDIKHSDTAALLVKEGKRK